MAPAPFAAEAERIRRHVNDTLLAAFSELSEGILIVDREARIVWMNEQYPRHLGIADPASVIGLPVEDLITHRFGLQDLQEAMHLNLRQEGIKLAYLAELNR